MRQEVFDLASCPSGPNEDNQQFDRQYSHGVVEGAVESALMQVYHHHDCAVPETSTAIPSKHRRSLDQPPVTRSMMGGVSPQEPSEWSVPLPPVPREIQFLREAKKRMEVYNAAAESLRSMHAIFRLYDPNLMIGMNARSSSGGGGAPELDAEDAFKLKRLRVQAKKANERRKKVHAVPIASRGAGSALTGEEDSEECGDLPSPMSPVTDGDASSLDAEDEVLKVSRWETHNGGEEGDELCGDSSTNAEVVAAERRLIEANLEAKAEELTAIEKLLEDFRQDQESRSHELDVVQHERSNELQRLGVQIGELEHRRDAETLVYDMELRMRMAGIPLILNRAARETKDASVGVSEDALIATKAVAYLARGGGASRLAVAPTGGGLMEPPAPNTRLPAELTRPFAIVPIGPSNGGASPQPSTLKSSKSAAALKRLPSSVRTKAATTTTAVPEEYLFVLRCRFGPSDLQEKLWVRDPVAYATATTQCLKSLTVVATRWRVFVSSASRSGFVIVTPNGADAVGLFEDLDKTLTSQHWESVVRGFEDMASVVHEEEKGGESPLVPTASRSASSGERPYLFNGPRLAGVLWVSRVTAQTKTRLRCDYNPCTLRHEFVGGDITLLDRMVSLARGGELLMTRNVWRCVLFCGPRRFPGYILTEHALRVGLLKTESEASLMNTLAEAHILYTRSTHELVPPSGALTDVGAGAYYVKLLHVMPFELRQRLDILQASGLWQHRRLAERQFVQPTNVLVSSPAPASNAASLPSDEVLSVEAEDGQSGSIVIPGDESDASWVEASSAATNSRAASCASTADAIKDMFFINLPEVMHVCGFQKSVDSSHVGVVIVSVPHVDALMHQPNGLQCLHELHQLMWICGRRVLASDERLTSGSRRASTAAPSAVGRIFVNHQLRPDLLQHAAFKEHATTDPHEAKAMLAELHGDQCMWLFRHPLHAVAFALLLQQELVRYMGWPEDLIEFYGTVVPQWLERRRGVTGDAASKPAPPKRGSMASTRSAKVAGSDLGLKVVMGVSSGALRYVTNTQTGLGHYESPCIEYARALARCGRTGEILLSPAQRDRVMGPTGNVVALPVLDSMYHVVSVAPFSTPDHLKVHAVISSELRDRQAHFGDMPPGTLESLNEAHAAMKRSMELALEQRSTQFATHFNASSMPTSPRNRTSPTRSPPPQPIQQRSSCPEVATALRRLFPAGGEASADNTGAQRHVDTVAHFMANDEEALPPRVGDALKAVLYLVNTKMRDADARAATALAAVASRSESLPRRDNASPTTAFPPPRSVQTVLPETSNASTDSVKLPPIVPLAQQTTAPQPLAPSPSAVPSSNKKDDHLPPIHKEALPSAAPFTRSTPPCTTEESADSEVPHAVSNHNMESAMPPEKDKVATKVAPLSRSTKKKSKSSKKKASERKEPSDDVLQEEGGEDATSTAVGSSSMLTELGTASTALPEVASEKSATAVKHEESLALAVTPSTSEPPGNCAPTVSPDCQQEEKNTEAPPPMVVLPEDCPEGKADPPPPTEVPVPDVEDSASDGDGATVPLAIFVELSQSLSALKKEREDLRRELVEVKRNLKIANAQRHAAAAVGSVSKRVIRAPSCDTTNGEEDATEVKPTRGETAPRSTQTTPTLLHSCGQHEGSDAVSLLPVVSVELSPVNHHHTSMHSFAGTSGESDPPLFSRASSRMLQQSSTSSHSLGRSDAFGDATGRSDAHRLGDSLVADVMSLVRRSESPATQPEHSATAAHNDGTAPYSMTSTQFSNTMHEMVASATAVVPWEAPWDGGDLCEDQPHQQPSRIPGAIIQGGSSKKPPIETEMTQLSPSAPKKGKPAQQRTKPPMTSSPTMRSREEPVAKRATHPDSHKGNDRFSAGPASTSNNTFTNYCEKELFEPMRRGDAEVPSASNAACATVGKHQQPHARTHHQQQSGGSTTTSTTTLPTAMLPTSPVAPRPGTEAYAQWLSALNDHVKDCSDAMRRNIR